MGGHRVGDCGLVPEDGVVAFVDKQDKEKGTAPWWSRPLLVQRKQSVCNLRNHPLGLGATTVRGALLFLLDDELYGMLSGPTGVRPFGPAEGFGGVNSTGCPCWNLRPICFPRDCNDSAALAPFPKWYSAFAFFRDLGRNPCRCWYSSNFQQPYFGYDPCCTTDPTGTVLRQTSAWCGACGRWSTPRPSSWWAHTLGIQRMSKHG